MTPSERRALYNRIRAEWMYKILWPDEAPVRASLETILEWSAPITRAPKVSLEWLINSNKSARN